MVQKRLLTEEELINLLNSNETSLESDINVENSPIADFLSFYGITHGEHLISGKNLYTLFKYKCKLNIPYAIFIKEISFYLETADNKIKHFLINKDLSYLFPKLKKNQMNEDTIFRFLQSFYTEFEIQNGSQIVISEKKLLEVIKYWAKIRRKVNYERNNKNLEKFLNKFFTKKDTKKGVYYSMKSDKLKRFMDEKEKNEKRNDEVP
jgi:hypothetical protein